MKDIVTVLSILLIYTGCTGVKMIHQYDDLSCEKNVAAPKSLELLEQQHRCSNK
jgi:hypothetical protein